MTDAPLPPLIEPEALEALLGRDDLLIVDLSRSDVHARAHVPGAVHLEYGRLVLGAPPAPGRLPDPGRLRQVLGEIGVSPERPLVVYDDEGGGKACRLLWTLSLFGLAGSLLNGGLHAWANEEHPLEQARNTPAPTTIDTPFDPSPAVEADYLLARLGDPELALLDARSAEEFSGERRYAMRGGHIPGAVNLDWQASLDPDRNLRLRPESELRALLTGRHITPEREVVCYCQTHHRSSHSWYVLKLLGYPRVKGYPGSWAEWGNRLDTPVEE